MRTFFFKIYLAMQSAKQKKCREWLKFFQRSAVWLEIGQISGSTPTSIFAEKNITDSNI